jgi:uncharacterized protein (TIGR00369 family)
MLKETFAKAGIFEQAQCSTTLGFELLELDLKAGTTKVKFNAKAEFLNPMGTIQGGFLAAMLDDTIGMLAMVKMGGKAMVSTIDLGVQYLRPVRIGDVTVCAKIVSTGKNIMFAEAELYDSRNKISTRATSSLALSKIVKGEE